MEVNPVNQTKPETAQKEGFLNIARGVANNALERLHGNVNKMNPDTKFALGYALGFGTLALGAGLLTAEGIKQAGGIKSFIEIASMSIKEYQEIFPNNPSFATGAAFLTRGMPMAATFFTGMTAIMGISAYRAQKEK